jgi:DNA-binding SARP family transcriptional activator
VGTLRLDVLGPLAIAHDGQPLPTDALPGGKVRELLLFLLVHEQVTKDAVGLALWPDASPAQVRNAFHVTLHHLRRLLGEQRWIAFERNAYRLDRAPAPGVTLDADVDAVLGATARLRQAARRQERLEPAALDAARAALERARGDFAEGVTAEDWVVSHQDRIRAAWADGMDALARLYVAAGRPDDTVAVCEALVAREPLRESAHRLLMEAHAARGEPARALAHHDALVALLAREVGATPARETRAVADAIRRAAARA